MKLASGAQKPLLWLCPSMFSVSAIGLLGEFIGSDVTFCRGSVCEVAGSTAFWRDPSSFICFDAACLDMPKKNTREA